MIIWTLVTEKIATLQEIETHWSLDDLIRISAVLDYRFSYNEEIRKNQERLNTKKRR